MVKALSNHLRAALGSVIDNNQSAYVPEDNVMVDFECNHWLRSRTRRRTCFAALKLDMSKAYDMIEWSYVWRMMEVMGFGPRCISRTMDFISTTKFSVLVNGFVSEGFSASRGLRPGDPLSPYLFLLCA